MLDVLDRSFGLFCALLCLAWTCPEVVEAELPSIEYVESPAIQRGASAKLKIVGANLGHAQELVFYEPGIACESIEARDNEELLVNLTASETCTLGLHAFRVRTEGGLSELRTLTLTPYPVVRELAADSRIELRQSIVGKLNEEHVSRYFIQLPANQRLSLDVEAMRLGVDMLDAALVVRDPDGHVVVRADDSNLYQQDPIASMITEKAGRYTIEVQDAGRNAGELAWFVMHVSDGPRPCAVFPLGGAPGSTVELKFTGDARGRWSTSLQLPHVDRGLETAYQLFAEQDGQSYPTAVPFRLSNLRNLFEPMHNDDLEDVPASGIADMPLAMNGLIEQPFDRDCFWVRGLPGHKVEVQAFARRLGSAADMLLTIVDSKQQILATSDDVDSLDSRVEFAVPQDALFGVLAEEKRGQGGEGYAYRIEVVAVQPTAEIFLPRRDRLSQDMQTISVPVGNRILALMAVRKDEADSQTNIRFPELPEGVTVEYTPPRANQAIVPVVFSAAPDARLSGRLVPVEVSAHSESGTALGKFHQVTDLVRGPADAIYTEHHADRLAICVRESYPLRVSVVQPKAGLAQDGTLELVVNIERQAGFMGDVHVTLPWLPAWIDAEPRITIPADETQALIRLRAWKQAEVAKWPLVVEASADKASRRRRSRGGPSGTGGGLGGDIPPPAALFPASITAQPVSLDVCPTPVAGRFEPSAAEQGQSITITCHLDGLDQLKDIVDLTATLEGLPNRVETQPVKIDRDLHTVHFQVTVSSTAPLGRYVGLACRLSGQLHGESVSYVVARDGFITIERPGQIMRDENGRPLSRVEALRKKSNPSKN